MHSPWVTRVLGGRELPPRATSPEGLVDASRDPAWSPWVLRRERVVALRAAELLAARSARSTRPLSELLPLVKRLHAARLEHAAALVAAGGSVPPAVRRELELRADRAPRRRHARS